MSKNKKLYSESKAGFYDVLICEDGGDVYVDYGGQKIMVRLEDWIVFAKCVEDVADQFRNTQGALPELSDAITTDEEVKEFDEAFNSDIKYLGE